VKKGFSIVSTRKLLLRLSAGCSRPPIMPRVALGSAAAKAGCQADPLPPSATETIGEVAVSPG